MKNTLFILPLLLLCTANLFSQNNTDKIAIQQVIEDETAYWAAKDYKGWEKSWLQIPEAGSAFNNPDGSYTAVIGWDAISGMMKESFQQEAMPVELVINREHFEFRFYGNGAYVTFDQYPGKKGEVRPSKEFRIMEKTKDGWKILSAISLWDYSE